MTQRTILPAAVLALLVLLIGCGSATPASSTPAAHGQLSERSRVDGTIVLCDHRVPEKVCTRHHPELVAEFQRSQDWCAPHGVPESQCFECHPDLTFDPLPELPVGADVQWLSKQGEDVIDLDAHAVVGKVTVVDFYAEWCAACRKVTGHLLRRIADGDHTVAYRKINVVTWDSPVALRYMQDVPTLPLIVVYGRDGKRVATLHGADLTKLDQAIAASAAR